MSFTEYLNDIPAAHRSILLFGGLTFFLLLENGLPFFRQRYEKLPHLGINLFFTFTTILVNFAMAVLLIESSRWVEAENIGLLQWMPGLPAVLYFLVGLLALDLVSAYFIHWAEHKVKWMWRFHLIHHTDPHVDTTTANRHHPGESVFRFAATVLGVIVCGAPVALVMLYQSLSALLSQFNHANIRLPQGLERALSWVIVTPRMHRVHHHYTQPYTDTNYGNIFSIWDRLFGTYAELDNDRLVFGIDTHMDAHEHSRIGSLLKIPFQPYRPPVGAKFAGPAVPPRGLGADYAKTEAPEPR